MWLQSTTCPSKWTVKSLWEIASVEAASQSNPGFGVGAGGGQAVSPLPSPSPAPWTFAPLTPPQVHRCIGKHSSCDSYLSCLKKYILPPTHLKIYSPSFCCTCRSSLCLFTWGSFQFSGCPHWQGSPGRGRSPDPNVCQIETIIAARSQFGL